MSTNEALALLGALALLAMFIWIFKGFFVGPFAERRTALTTQARRFLDDVTSTRYDEAYMRMSETYRRGVTREQFRDALANNEHLRRLKVMKFREYEELEGTAQLTFVLEAEAGEVRAIFSYSRQGDDWSIVGITVGGLPAVPVSGPS